MLFNGLQTLDELHWSSQCPREVKKPKSPQAFRHFGCVIKKPKSPQASRHFGGVIKKPKSAQASRHFDACMFMCDKGAIIHFNLPIGNTNQG